MTDNLSIVFHALTAYINITFIRCDIATKVYEQVY